MKMIIKHIIFDQKKHATNVVFYRHFRADRIHVRREKHVPNITYFKLIFECQKRHISETPLIFIVIPPKKHFPPPCAGDGVAGAAGWRVGGLAGLAGLAGWLGWLAGWLAWLAGWLGWLAGIGW